MLLLQLIATDQLVQVDRVLPGGLSVWVSWKRKRTNEIDQIVPLDEDDKNLLCVAESHRQRDGFIRLVPVFSVKKLARGGISPQAHRSIAAARAQQIGMRCRNEDLAD